MILAFQILLVLIWSVEGVDITYKLSNKTKRTLSQQLFNYGETNPKPIFVYRENYVPPAFISDDYSTLKPEYRRPVPFDILEPINFYHQQLPPPQKLYDFPKLVRNGQVFNRDEQPGHYKEHLTGAVDGQNLNYVPSESVVLPIEHRKPYATMPQPAGYPSTANIRYKLVPLAKVPTQGTEKGNYELYSPLPVSNYQSPPYVNQYSYQPRVNTFPLFPNQYSSQFQRVPNVPNVDYTNRNYVPRKQNINGVKYPTPQGRNNLNKKPLQVNYSPQKTSFKKEKNVTPKTEDEELPTKRTQKNEDNNSESKSTSEDEENDQDSSYHEDPYDFEESSHFDTEEEYDRDNKRSSTLHLPLRKYSSKQSKNGKSSIKDYKFPHGDYKQDHLKPRPNTNDRPKTIYKAVNFAKETDETNEDSIEGKHSENIPVTRKHSVLREKWYITKDIDDPEKE